MVSSNEEQLKALAVRLFEINAFKFGDYKMKIGVHTPVYFDLRVIVSYPEVMQMVADLIVAYIREHELSAKHVCGVPYTALPLATLVSVAQDLPMLVRRKETKDYGTKKLIEGIYKSGDTCLIVEDVVTSGSSIMDTVRDLTREGIVSTAAVVLVDREQGGMRHIAEKGVRTHALFTLSFLMKTLHEAGKVPSETVEAVSKFIASCQINADGTLVNALLKPIETNRIKMSFEERASHAKCALGRDIFNLMAQKKTNLCVAADLTKAQDILNLAEVCGPHICLLKTHVDIIEDFSLDFARNLQQLAEQHRFIIMEDRKFADIGNTVSLQYSSGMYKIVDWAHLVTAHSLSGSSILQGLKRGIVDSNVEKRGVFLLAEMSAAGNLIDDKYKSTTVSIANDANHADIVVGIVCQSVNCFSNPGLIQLTPGVNISDSGDSLGQQYQPPEHVMQQQGADIAVVGRGIYEAKSIEKTAAMYRDRLWHAYEMRLNN